MTNGLEEHVLYSLIMSLDLALLPMGSTSYGTEACTSVTYLDLPHARIRVPEILLQDRPSPGAAVLPTSSNLYRKHDAAQRANGLSSTQ